MAVKVADLVKERPGRRLDRVRRRRDQAQVRHGLRQAVPQGQRGRRGLSLHRAACAHQPPPGQGAGRGVRSGLDQEPRPQLTAAPSQPVLLRLRVRKPRRGHPADPLQAGAQPGRAVRLGQEAACAADRRDRREAPDPGVHDLPQLGGGVSARRDRKGLRLVRHASSPKTLAELCQQMRGNLMGVWRQPAEQEKSKTKRREKDIRAEVLRGYEVARSVIDRGLAKHPDDWALVLARATLMHDENNYLQEIERTPEFAPRRQKAFAEFRRAAQLYAKAAPGPRAERRDNPGFRLLVLRRPRGLRPPAHHRGDALGPAPAQADPRGDRDDSRRDRRAAPEQVRQCSLHAAEPGQAVDQVPLPEGRYRDRRRPSAGVRGTQGVRLLQGPRHRDQARGQGRRQRSSSATSSRSVSSSTFATPARSSASQAGSAAISRTRTIQDTLTTTSAGRSRTIATSSRMPPSWRSRSTLRSCRSRSRTRRSTRRRPSEYGWRVTPYAYLLLKARGPKVDKVPPLRLDLDFMDTSGYVVLPVESPTIPVDATPAKGAVRPFEKLQLTQTLDERQAGEGKLIVEIKAVARGLVPDVNDFSRSINRASSARRLKTKASRFRSSTRTARRR